MRVLLDRSNGEKQSVTISTAQNRATCARLLVPMYQIARRVFDASNTEMNSNSKSEISNLKSEYQI